MQLIECVPNFSEGRNLETIEKIAQVIREVPAVHLLDVDSNYSANRTVMTFVGEPQSVIEAALKGMDRAQALIDMRTQKGVHPRIGAIDVCPLVPITGITMSECIELSHALARRVAQELAISVYLYAKSAQVPERVKLAHIRKGQYEELEQRMVKDGFTPDYGLCRFSAKSGATAIGARNLLVAYNINLDTKSIEIAEAIALQIRKMRNAAEPETTGGDCDNFGGATAIGWYIEEFKRAQVSMNILDFKKTPLSAAFSGVERLAAMHNVAVTGSEIIGLVPLAPLLEAGRYHRRSRNLGANGDDYTLVDEAINWLQLGDTKTFDRDKKILDYRLRSLFPSINIMLDSL